jgi:hypothetical protein
MLACPYSQFTAITMTRKVLVPYAPFLLEI